MSRSKSTCKQWVNIWNPCPLCHATSKCRIIDNGESQKIRCQTKPGVDVEMFGEQTPVLNEFGMSKDGWGIIKPGTDLSWGKTERLLDPEVIESVLDEFDSGFERLNHNQAEELYKKILAESMSRCVIDDIKKYLEMAEAGPEESVISDIIQRGAR
jgi:hypothetical protein